MYFVFFFLLSKMFLRTLSPESWGIEGYSPTTSTVTRIALLGIHNVLNFSHKVSTIFNI